MFSSFLWQDLAVVVLNVSSKSRNGSIQTVRRRTPWLLSTSLHFSMWRGPLFKLLPPSWLTPERREAKAPRVFWRFSLLKKTGKRQLNEELHSQTILAFGYMEREAIRCQCFVFVFFFNVTASVSDGPDWVNLIYYNLVKYAKYKKKKKIQAYLQFMFHERTITFTYFLGYLYPVAVMS